jgi:AcrR family transcriptional regulator
MPRKSTPKPYHHGDLKNALVAAGLHILNEQGAGALNLREVARRAEVSHTAPYRHFPDKQALIAAIAEQGFEMLADEIRRSDASASAGAVEKLIAAGSTYVMFALDHPAHIKLMFSRDNVRAADSDLYRISKFGFEYMVRTIQTGQQKGELGMSDPVDGAKHLWSALHGLAMLAIERQLVMLNDLPEDQFRAGLQSEARALVRVVLAGSASPNLQKS